MKYFYITISALAVILLGIIAFAPKTAQQVLGDAGSPNYFQAASNTSSTCASGTSTLALAAAGDRLFAYVTNPSATGTYVCQSPTCTSGTGIYLGQGNSFRIDLNNRYVGALSCTGNGATSSVSLSYNQ